MDIDLPKTADMLRGYHAGMSGHPFIKTETADWQEGWHIAQQHAAMEA